MIKKFNKNFIFSLSTCAFQIEGGRYEGGRKESIWDKFTKENYFIPKPNSNKREINYIDKSSNFYEKFNSDIEIMDKIGINGFVYNLDWARIMPSSIDEINEEGLQFYENVFKKLIEKNIKPIPIIYHWDTPSWLEKLGGASDKIFIKAFRKFSRVLFKRLGKYTNIWFVSDENSTFTTSAYLDKYMPPQKNNPIEFWKSLHVLNLSAAASKEEFEIAKEKGFIDKDSMLGIDHDWNPAIPYDENNKEDIKSCKIFNEYNLKLWLDPNIKGTYPKCFYENISKYNLEYFIKDEEIKFMKENTLDLIGWNYYRPAIIANPKRLNEDIEWQIPCSKFITNEALIVFPKNLKYTKWNWLIKPENIIGGSKVLQKLYNKPIMIIENGLGDFESKKNGIVHDTDRIIFLNKHLQIVQKAIEEGVNFIGYSIWTYCDIYSPSGGYRKKYGLVGVDFEDKNLKRFPKSSFYWYQDVITSKTTHNKENISIYKEKALKDKTQEHWK